MEDMALGETVCETRCQPLINYCCVDFLPIHSDKISISDRKEFFQLIITGALLQDQLSLYFRYWLKHNAIVSGTWEEATELMVSGKKKKRLQKTE